MTGDLTLEERVEHARLTALVEALTIAVFLVDTEGTIAELNNRLANLLQIDADQLIGEPYQALFAKLLEQAAEPEVLQKSLADAVPAITERPVVPLVTNLEPPHNLEATFFPVWEQDGAPIGWGGLIQDVTEERQRVAWKLELLSILSHDIRAPLATLKGHSTAILENFRQWDDAMVMEFLEAINRSTDKLIKQVERNLALTRVESGRLGLRPEACDPGRMIRNALERAAALLDDREVEISLSDGLPTVRADPARIEELLVNLLDNAARFSPADRPIELQARAGRGKVEISIVDHGPGVPANRQTEIFRKNVQGDRQTGSSGLGLYISRKIAEAHGGKLWVESPLPGADHGARFAFTLPAIPRAQLDAPAPDQAALTRQTEDQLRVLIAEDELDFQTLIRTAVQEAGYQVELAPDGPTAVDIVQSSAPDLVILDWILPGMDGLQVCRNIRRWSQAPILMITSKTAQEDLVAAFEAGVDDYLTKPFRTPELLARLKALARRREVAAPEDNRRLSIGGLLIDFDLRQAWLSGEQLELTPTEFELLAYLAQHRGQVLTHQQLLDHLYGSTVDRGRHDLFVHVSRLRKKIESDPKQPTFIQTRWGVGYVFSAP